MKWYWFQLVAILRGLSVAWPSMPPIPKGYTGVSCALRSWQESRSMFSYGWIPYAVQRTWDGTVSRMFIVVDEFPEYQG